MKNHEFSLIRTTPIFTKKMTELILRRVESKIVYFELCIELTNESDIHLHVL